MESGSTMPTPGFSISMSLGDALLILFLVILALYIVFSVVLHYHWKQYGTNARMTLITFVTYGVMTVPLVVLLGIVALLN